MNLQHDKTYGISFREFWKEYTVVILSGLAALGYFLLSDPHTKDTICEREINNVAKSKLENIVGKR